MWWCIISSWIQIKLIEYQDREGDTLIQGAILSTCVNIVTSCYLEYCWAPAWRGRRASPASAAACSETVGKTGRGLPGERTPGHNTDSQSEAGIHWPIRSQVEKICFFIMRDLTSLTKLKRQSCINVYSEMTWTQINSPTFLVTGIREAEMFTKTYRGRINAVIVHPSSWKSMCQMCYPGVALPSCSPRVSRQPWSPLLTPPWPAGS